MPKDFRQIEEASKVENMVLKVGNRLTRKEEKVTQGQAINLLGRDEFLSGIGRASFHWTAARESLDGRMVVYFDATNYFRKYL